MKVVHIVAKDVGGAARAALRINYALNQKNIDSSVLVLEKVSGESSVIPIFSNLFIMKMYKVIRKINDIRIRKYCLLGKFYESRIGVDITNLDIIKNAEVVNLHWINDGMLNNYILKKLLKSGKKIVWTMHDMFSFTAGCYYDFECGQYRTGCKECPLAIGNKGIEKYIKKQYLIKQKVYKDSNLTFIGCSEWMANCASKSVLVDGKKVTVIPNPIDTTVFAPVDKNEALRKFGIHTNKKIVLFGAMSADSDPRKGFEYLKEALKLLDSEKYLAVVFGNNFQVTDIYEGFETVCVGKIYSDKKLAQLYSLADVFVAPSMQENLSNAVMEALSCGAPVVAFNIGGMQDMILHKTTGYLAEPFSVKDLASGIVYCSERDMDSRCREYVIEKFNMDTIGKQYYSCYQEG